MASLFFAKKISTFVPTVIFALCGTAPVTAQVRTAVEYFRLGPGYWDYDVTYFLTSFPDEIAALDAGALGGAWRRTGATFNIWSGPESGALPTCRFFNTTYGTHFYTPYAAECAALQTDPTGQWQYEGIAFYLQLPDGNGNCSTGTAILYRLYNNAMSGWPVHRFTTGPVTSDQVQAAGWVFEGDSRTHAAACVPLSTVASRP